MPQIVAMVYCGVITIAIILPCSTFDLTLALYIELYLVISIVIAVTETFYIIINYVVYRAKDLAL